MTRITSFLRAHAGHLAALALFALAFYVSPGLALAGGGVFALGTVSLTQDVIKLLIAFGLLDAAGGVKKNIVAKTADYTILSASDPSGTIFTNRAAVGAVIFTLPAAAPALAGVVYEFLGIADQSFSVKTPVADTLLVVNDIAADSLAVSTASHKIGAHMKFICDGVAWAGYGDSVGDTFTVAT